MTRSLKKFDISKHAALAIQVEDRPIRAGQAAMASNRSPLKAEEIHHPPAK
jgi:hypothetical protein